LYFISITLLTLRGAKLCHSLSDSKSCRQPGVLDGTSNSINPPSTVSSKRHTCIYYYVKRTWKKRGGPSVALVGAHVIYGQKLWDNNLGVDQKNYLLVYSSHRMSNNDDTAHVDVHDTDPLLATITTPPLTQGDGSQSDPRQEVVRSDAGAPASANASPSVGLFSAVAVFATLAAFLAGAAVTTQTALSVVLSDGTKLSTGHS
jgi:hypothetical protein